MSIRMSNEHGNFDTLRGISRSAPVFALLLAIAQGSALAQQVALKINDLSGPNITTCSTTLDFSASYTYTFYIAGTYTFTFTLYRNSKVYKTQSAETSCEYDASNPSSTPCQVDSLFKDSELTGNGTSTYEVNETITDGGGQVYANVNSNMISVTASNTAPMAIPKINGNATHTYGQADVSVCAIGPIIMDGSSSCGNGDYFLSVERSDPSWNLYAPEAMRWLTASDYSKYGPISNFNVMRFAEDQYFGFVGGQYYRVKLATGPGWNEQSQVIAIEPNVSGLKINGNLGPTVNILGPSYPIIMDGSSSTCASQYFLSVQLSDAASNKYGPEAMRWLAASDYAKYGPLNHFDAKKFAEDQWFAFVAGQYYRVKLATGPVWSETTTLIYIKP